MKKRIMLIIAVIMTLFLLTGCEKTSITSDNKEIEEFNSIAKGIKESGNLGISYDIPDGYTVEYKGNNIIRITKDEYKIMDYSLEANEPMIVHIEYQYESLIVYLIWLILGIGLGITIYCVLTT